MEILESAVIAMILPLIPAASCAYLFDSRWLFYGAIAGSFLGVLFFSPVVMANFGPEATIRDMIIFHALSDLPTSLVGALLGGLPGYWLDPKHPSKRQH